MSGEKKESGALGSYVAMNLIPIAISLCNIPLFHIIFYRDAFADIAALDGVVQFITRLADSDTSNLILMGALTFAAIVVPANNMSNLKEYTKLSGKDLNACRAFLNTVLLLGCYPLVQLGLFAFKWLCWFFCVAFLQFGDDISWMMRMVDAMSTQQFCIPATVVVYIVLFCKLVLWRIKDNPFRRGGAGKKKAAGSAAKKGAAAVESEYSLPASYAVGLKYVVGDNARQYMDSFRNSTHLLHWVTQTMELGFAKMGNSGYATWTVSSPDYKENFQEFATNASIQGVKWNDFSILCTAAAQGWLSRGEIAKAVHCDELLVRTAYTVAANEAWPYRGPCRETSTVSAAYDRLIEIYRFGRGDIAVSTERAVSHADDADEFFSGVARSREKGEKAIADVIKEHGGGGAAARPAAAGGGSGSGFAHEWGTDALPSTMTRYDEDGTPHVYHRMNAASAYPAWYSCPDGAPDAMIFTAAVSAGTAYTDCGEFLIF